MWLALVAEPPPTVLVADPPPLLKLKRVVAAAAAAAAEQNGDAGVVAAAATPAVPSFNAQLLLKLHNYIRDITEHPAFEGITCGAPSKLGEGFAQQERRGECP